uniref:Proteasome subunit beta type-1-like n=1 Tax=Dermatophagoides pteronyssinus TaxID=6956 RepID=A0A6P6Y7I6_DERPT|nr:proteasome subunit beta type-1-like [Dermatophagoides pteronyssinus]
MSEWSPYQDNGGTALAVAGRDFVVLSADTRCSAGYSILSRRVSRVTQLTDRCCIASCGQLCEIQRLHKRLKLEVRSYAYKHGVSPSVHALRQFLSVELYERRLFPYYTFNILAGLDDEGAAVVYGYDAIGNTEPLSYAAVGCAAPLVLPAMDVALRGDAELDATAVAKLQLDLLTVAAEREIKTGDFVETFLLTAAGVETRMATLKQD